MRYNYLKFCYDLDKYVAATTTGLNATYTSQFTFKGYNFLYCSNIYNLCYRSKPVAVDGENDPVADEEDDHSANREDDYSAEDTDYKPSSEEETDAEYVNLSFKNFMK